MKKLMRITAVLLIYAVMITTMCSCSEQTPQQASQTTSTKTVINSDITIDDNDIENSIDISKANKITFKNNKATASNNCAKTDGGFVTIENAGVYVVEGSATNGQIKVKAQDTDVVAIVLYNADITNKNGAALHIKKAKKAYVIPYKNTKNKLSDTAQYKFDADDNDGEPDATIFSKSDLVISGSGTLNIDANYSNAIKGKDNVLITSADITADSVDDGIKGRDSLTIAKSKITVTAQNSAIKTTNEEDTTLANMTLSDSIFNINCKTDAFNCKNTLTISGGTFEIEAGDDAFHADATLIIKSGDINIKSCYEGLESQQIKVSGGNIHIVSSDDGLNSAGGNDSSAFDGGRKDPFATDMNAVIDITGGYIYVNSEGDGIDSNGTINMSGGTVLVDGPQNGGNGSLDYTSTFTCTGGLLVACGTSGMAQAVSDTSSQYCIMADIPALSAETLFSIIDDTGTPLITYSPSKPYSNIVVCSDKLKSGKTYYISTGGNSSDKQTDGLYDGQNYSGGTTVLTLTLNSIVTSNSTQMNHMGGMGGRGDRPMHTPQPPAQMF